LIGSFVFLALLALGFYGAAGGGLALGSLLGATLSFLPALWVMAGLAAVLVGWLPKLYGAIWAIFAYSFVVFYFGRLFDLPQWAAKLSPLGNIAQLPAETFSLSPLLVLTLMAAVLTAAGVVGFRRRDIG
jgi:ABC-2 type transport system permease protein